MKIGFSLKFLNAIRMKKTSLLKTENTFGVFTHTLTVAIIDKNNLFATMVKDLLGYTPITPNHWIVTSCTRETCNCSQTATYWNQWGCSINYSDS